MILPVLFLDLLRHLLCLFVPKCFWMFDVHPNIIVIAVVRLSSYPGASALPRETVRSLVFYALRVWAEPTPLEFHEVCGLHLTVYCIWHISYAEVQVK